MYTPQHHHQPAAALNRDLTRPQITPADLTTAERNAVLEIVADLEPSYARMTDALPRASRQKVARYLGRMFAKMAD